MGYWNSLSELFGKERPFLKEMWKKYWSPIWKVWKACQRKSRFRKKIWKDNSLTNYVWQPFQGSLESMPKENPFLEEKLEVKFINKLYLTAFLKELLFWSRCWLAFSVEKGWWWHWWCYACFRTCKIYVGKRLREITVNYGIVLLMVMM